MLYDPNSLVGSAGFLVDPNNRPLALPGAYGVFCLDTRKWYIGISQNLCLRLKSHNSNRGKGHFRNAIRKYGREHFVFIPLLYSITGTDWLGEQETELISQFDSAKNGYNMVFTDGRAGPYGKKFAEFVKASLSSAEVRRRISEGTRRGLETAIRSGTPRTGRSERIARLKSSEMKAIVSVSSRRAWADPESRARRMRSKLIASADPIVRQKIFVSTRKALNNPVVSTRHSGTVTGYIWITDGSVDRWIDLKNIDIPEGWRKGRARFALRRWINNGFETKMIDSSELMPKGWNLGRKTQAKVSRER